ncbi:MAG TPA: DUF6036 family nucleotidyltransferase [Gemmataceae bacterium]|nr:DUF6036 family nucleotidyltransferase [Gemmataceae bacterium]
MDRSEIVRFLEAIDEELAKHARKGERLDLYLVGRAALILRYGLALATKDVDLVTRGDVPALQARAFELFGKGAANAKKWGLYLEGVPEGLPPVPGSYRRLSVELPGDWKVLRPKQLDPHDLAVTKLRRFHAGDREDLRILCDSGDLTRKGLERALDSAYPFGMDEEEDPDCKRVNDHFRRVIDYLEGRSGNL